MGMSSSQARLLSLTARMHDIEYRAQRLEAQKLQLANESDKAYSNYLRVLDSKKLQYRTILSDGSITYKDATLASLENSLVPSYTGETSNKAFFLQDAATGAIYISKDYAAKIGITSDSDTYSGSLNAWLTEKNAPKKVVSINTVSNSDISDYTPDSYTYEKAVSNTSETLPNKLVSGKTYSVSTADDLVHIANLINGGQDTTGVTIVLGSDINMGSVSGFSSINNFKGTFDGNGHEISSLKTSLFNTLNGATVSNLKVVNSNILLSSSGKGCLANTASNSTISNVIASGSVTSDESRIGGFIGYLSNSNVSQCSFSGTVSGISSVGGFVGSSTNSQITNCSSNGTVNCKVQSGGFIGIIDGNTISHCSSNASINIHADETTGNPDCGGFIGIAGNYDGRVSNISNCSAKGTLTDTSTSGHQTIDAGFMGFANQGTTTISNCDSSVNLNTNQVFAIGFAGIWNEHTAKLVLNNCNYTGNINTTNTNSTGFSHVESAVSGLHSIQINNCYTSVSSYPNYTDNGNCTNLGMTWKSSPNSNDTSVVPPSLSTSAVSGDAIPTSDLGSSVATIPLVNTTTGNGSYNSNILAVMAKSGKIDLKTISSSELADWNNKIVAFLSQFDDNATDNSKLYYLNNKMISYLNGTNVDPTFATQLYNDLINGTIAYTDSYQQGALLNSTSRSAQNKAWTPTYHALEKGEMTIPNKATIKANIMAALKKEKSSITESQVDAFLGQYGASQQDYASLAYVNDIVNNYAKSNGSLSELISALSSGNKITTIPSYIDDIANYEITMNSVNQSSSVRVVEDFDMENEITKTLVSEYNALKNGYIIIGDSNDAGMDKSSEWLTNMVSSGAAIIREFDYENMSVFGRETSVSTETVLVEVQDEKELRKAEAKYEADMRQIDMKDRRYDTELAAVDAERNAIKQEMDTLKNVIKDNVEMNFKLFS